MLGKINDVFRSSKRLKIFFFWLDIKAWFPRTDSENGATTYTSLRSKRFRLVSKQRKTEERDSRFWPREKWAPFPLFYLRHFSRGLWLSFLVQFAPKPHGNACYAGYTYTIPISPVQYSFTLLNTRVCSRQIKKLKNSEKERIALFLEIAIWAHDKANKALFALFVTATTTVVKSIHLEYISKVRITSCKSCVWYMLRNCCQHIPDFLRRAGASRSLRVPQSSAGSSAHDRIERVIILLVRVRWKSWRRRAG